jgi:hypothetical protein
MQPHDRLQKNIVHPIQASTHATSSDTFVSESLIADRKKNKVNQERSSDCAMSAER